MDLYTHPIQPTETALLELVKRTQTTRDPIMLAVEGETEPTAVLMKVDAYEKSQRQQQRFYQLQLLQLKQWLARVEAAWGDQTVRRECVNTWQESMGYLWDVCPESARGLCASLMLSVKLLNADQLSAEQVAALHYCIALLRSVVPTEAEIDRAYQLLIQSGLPPSVSFDQSLVQSYLDET